MSPEEAAVRELLVDCVLQDIVVRQFSARLRAQEEDAPEGLSESEAASDLGMGFDVREGHVDYAFTVKVASKTVEAMAEVVTRYQLKATETTEDVLVHFANRVAFFAAYPYLREVIHASTNRLPGTQAFVLPIVQDPPGFVRAPDVVSEPQALS
jgi:hypothetical protein